LADVSSNVTPSISPSWRADSSAVENFRFFDLNVYALADVQGAVAEVKGEGLIKSTGRMYRQNYVIFLRAMDGKIAFLREHFDPVRAAKALNTPILGLES
jgi:ketosteroid isomerase-like protein